MNIVWAQNPLLTVVELDEHDRRWFRERLRSLFLEECISSAHLDLDSKWREHLASRGLVTSLEGSVAAAICSLRYEYSVCGGECGGTTLETVLDDDLDLYVSELKGEHDGDCVCVPCTCSKCYAERVLGIDTLPGLGKHEAHKIRSAFSREGATIDDVVRRLAEFEPVYKHSPTWPEEEWRKSVPRWKEEARRASVWLETYRKERLSGA